MRTNIVIDDELMAEAMRLSGCRSKRETVETALRVLLQVKRQAEARELLQLKPEGWEEGLSEQDRAKLKRFDAMMEKLSYADSGGRRFTREQMNER